VRRFGFLFPGQGSQHAGMGRDLAERFPVCAETFEQADRALGRSISEICFAGDDETLALTENTQPAILTVSVAALRTLTAAGLRPIAAAGHSLGEYSAHVAAGTLPFEQAVQTVQQRGRFMQQAVPVGVGAMAAVLGLDAAAVDELCAGAAQGQVLSAANMNGPGQVVVAGHAEAVARVVQAAPEAGATRAVPLSVSAPFHCALMQPAQDQLKLALEQLEFSDPKFPVYANVDAEPVRDGAGARDALVRQVSSPVRWEQSMRNMIESGIETFVEIGPGRVLAGLSRRIRRDVRVLGVSGVEGVEKVVKELGGEL